MGFKHYPQISKEDIPSMNIENVKLNVEDVIRDMIDQETIAASTAYSEIDEMRCPNDSNDINSGIFEGMMGLGTTAEFVQMGAEAGGVGGAVVGGLFGLGGMAAQLWARIDSTNEKHETASHAATSNTNFTDPSGASFTTCIERPPPHGEGPTDEELKSTYISMNPSINLPTSV